MKIFIMSFIMCTFIFTQIPAVAQNKSGIEFRYLTNWKKVLQEAKNEHKSIFVDVYTTWCGPCKTIDMDVYKNPDVGRLMNGDFISIKMQMDSTKNDNAYVKNFRADAKLFNVKYKVEGYPTFLFFNPDGELVNRDIGLKTVEDFIALAKVSINPNFNYSKLIGNYRMGKKDYDLMPELVKAVEQMKITALADSLVFDLKTHLGQIGTEKLLNRPNLIFLSTHSKLIKIDDNIFKLCYEKSDLVDSITNVSWSKSAVRSVIQRDLIIDRYLTTNNKTKGTDPDWVNIQDTIGKIYPKVDTTRLILDAQLEYYTRLKEWGNYSIYWSKRLKLHPPTTGLEGAVYLNNKAWMIFNSSNDRTALNNALLWCDMDMKIRSIAPDFLGTLDTKANILYKLGRKSEAIELEEKAMITSTEFESKPQFKGKVFFIDITKNLYRMNHGLPTWPELKP